MTKLGDGERTQKLVDFSSNGDQHDQFDLISWVEAGYVRARFGGMSVLVTPELAAQIRAYGEKQS